MIWYDMHDHGNDKILILLVFRKARVSEWGKNCHDKDTVIWFFAYFMKDYVDLEVYITMSCFGRLGTRCLDIKCLS